jgi:tocopherol O-methyltransferase
MVEPRKKVSSADVSQHYDELDRFYRAIWGEHLHHGVWEKGTESVEQAVRGLSKKVAALARVRQGHKVCDIGCGYGGTSEILANEHGANVLGLTISSEQFQRAKKRKAKAGKLSFALMDWLDNGLPSSHFDAAIAIESSEHMIDKKKFFTEAYRVLAPGGRMVICAWTSRENPPKWQAKHLLRPICAEGRLPSMLTPSEYKAHLKSAGFTEIEEADLSHLVARTWSISLLRTVKYFALKPAELRFLLPLGLRSADFARSLVRIALAYRSGAMKYSLLSATKR